MNIQELPSNWPQRQDSVAEQLADLRIIANRLGFYDAADAISQWCENIPPLDAHMTNSRYAELMRDDSLRLTKEEMSYGWHFCYDWDGLLVGPGMFEQECCCCFQCPYPPSLSDQRETK